MLLRIREELTEYVYRAALKDLQKDTPRLVVGRLGDQFIQRARFHEEVLVHCSLELLQEVVQPRQPFQGIRSVILHQMLSDLGCIRVADERHVLRCPEGAIRTAGPVKLKTVLFEFESFQHLISKDEHAPRTHVVFEPIKQLFGRCHAPGPVVLLNAQNRESVLGQDCCRCESVVACTYHNGIKICSHVPPFDKDIWSQY